MAGCMLCPRRCGADREAGQTGVCGMDGHVRVARAAPHYWEEPVISGHYGAGAVFFSGCPLRCRYCQNYDISAGGFGRAISVARLREIFAELAEQGMHNLDLVTGTHFVRQILQALEPKPALPVVWNTSGYETIDTLRALEGKVDIYLPDLKYADEALAAQLSGAPDYVRVATAAIEEMYRQVGPAQLDADGILRRGLVVRHLILPGHIGNSLDVLSWIADHLPAQDIYVSLMSQYVPMGPAAQTPPFDRRITELEYDAVRSWMELCGLTRGFTQDPSAATAAYTPLFDLEGV